MRPLVLVVYNSLSIEDMACCLGIDAYSCIFHRYLYKIGALAGRYRYGAIWRSELSGILRQCV